MMPDFLRRMSIHRLVLYYLAALLGLSEILCLAGILPYRPMDLLFTSIVIGLACWAGNEIFARVWAAKSNADSVLITALILILIITPVTPSDTRQIGYAIFASLWAMAAKYMLTLGRRNIFNPAAFGVALAALALGSSVSWWVGGSLYLLPLTIGGGVLVLLKMNVTEMVLTFAGADILTVALTSPTHEPLKSVNGIVLHSMFFFFAFVMLTEPRTAPLGRAQKLIYGALVGVLFAPEIHLGPWYTTPELALLAGNIFAALTYVQRRRAVANA
jgi:Na+-transporting NADH:ubiquinone oxidoreductase subunit NqrB